MSIRARYISHEVAALLAILAVAIRILVPSAAAAHASAPAPHASAPSLAADRTSAPRVAELRAAAPIRFEPNVGQAGAPAQAVARTDGYGVLLSATGAALDLDGSAGARALVTLRLAGANARSKVSLEARLPGSTNYLLGPDPASWRTDVGGYARARFAGVYPGIDVVYYGNDGELEYDFAVAAGADPRPIRLRAEGATSVTLDARGDLVIRTHAGEVRQLAPVAYQPSPSGRRPVAARYTLEADGAVGFRLGAYDRSAPLVIDPVVSVAYSTYLGGSRFDQGRGIAVDACGNVIVAGASRSADFPLRRPLRSALGDTSDAFVSKLTSDGSRLLFSTYLGGSGWDQGFAVAVDARGDIYVTGETGSADFPQRRAAQGFGGLVDAFVVKLSADGRQILYSTFLGGERGEAGNGIAVDAAGSAYVAGATASDAFPLVSPIFHDPVPAADGEASQDGFLAKLAPEGSSLVYSTYLGGNGYEYVTGVAVDPAGNAYVAGATDASDFPLANPLQAEAPAPQRNGFVTKVNAAGTALVFSTYLGSSGEDFAYGIATDDEGNAYVTGSTDGADFPNTGQPVPVAPFTPNAFVTKIAADGSTIRYSTLVGARNADVGAAVQVDEAGNAHLLGTTVAGTFSPLDPAQPATGGFDVFYALVNASGALAYSAQVGGRLDEGLSFGGLAVDRAGNVYLTAATTSDDLFVKNALQPRLGGAGDAFVVKLSSGRALPVTIASAARSPKPFQLTLTGEGFQTGARVFIGTDAEPWPEARVRSCSQLRLSGDGLKAKFPRGVPVTILVVNPDGGEATVTFTR